MYISATKPNSIQFKFHDRVGEAADGDLGNCLQKGTEKPPVEQLNEASVGEGMKNEKKEDGESGKSVKDGVSLRMCVIEWLRV